MRIRFYQVATVGLLWAAASGWSEPGRAQSRRPITETDLFKFVWIADPQISPDGHAIAFVRVTVNEREDRYDTALWLVPADGSQPPRRLSAGPRDLAPRWSPDGKWLALLRSVERDGKPAPPQLYLMPTDGGEARALMDLPRAAGPAVWSPDGRSLAFTSTTTPEDIRKRDQPRAERESDVRVITRAEYRSNGAGYLDPEHASHIWRIAVPADPLEKPEPRQVTTGAFEESNPTWGPRGDTLYFTSNRVAEPYYQPSDRDLFSIPADGGELRLVASIDGQIGAFSLSPDGRQIAFAGAVSGNPVRSYSQSDLFVTSSAPGGTPKNLTTAYDFDVNSGLSGDQRAPRGSFPGGVIWTADGRSLIVVVAEHGNANLKRIDAGTGRVDPLTSGNQEIQAYSVTADRSTLALLISTPTNVGDLFALGTADAPPAAPKRLSDVNHDLAAQIAQSEPEEIWYSSFDGKRIQGWILKPPDFDPTRKYPFILEIHGGPHAAYGNTYTHEFAWMAAKGYVVLYTNPRGSTSYGQDFGNIIQFHYPGDDYRDLMAGVDEMLKRGYIDEKRLGVTGGSGGGVLTNWTITHTTRFAAAVSQRSIADWSGFWYTADFSLFEPSWFRAAPWEDPKDFTERSSITYVARVRTPLMLIEGEADMRTPPSDGGEQMFRALKYLKQPVVMVRFPDETHELSRSGKPWHRVERLRHILGWFDKYLQGRAQGTGDLPQPGR